MLSVISVLLRAPIAAAVGVSKYQWAAALGIPTGCLWLELSILRGALQGVGDYKSVGISLIAEQAGRLLTGATLAAIGLGVTGAYLGSPLSFVIVGDYCAWMLNVMARTVRIPSAVAGADANGVAPVPTTDIVTDIDLWTHVRRAWAPIAA